MILQPTPTALKQSEPKLRRPLTSEKNILRVSKNTRNFLLLSWVAILQASWMSLTRVTLDNNP